MLTTGLIVFGTSTAFAAPVVGLTVTADDETTEEDAEEKDEAWDVDHPELPLFDQPIDCQEGTWINLDVSPEGDEIAFDFLGDIYLMPMAGGEPRKLTSGISWDMQPRFSPDGKWVAFTSDRLGKGKKCGDNIWIISRDGESTVQITDESFRLLNAPAWSPDGEYIVARKHFTSRRSLGAGEMWLYHRSGVDGGGSGGVQLTSKPTDQKDVNEPIYDPSGRYLYYSEDVSSGSTFAYNKDSHGQIYVVQRLDLEKNETERYITGPGGACRPTPSPDGQVIAFVRRVDGKTGLHLFDTKSGAVKMLFDGLERDMQEAWAIHGVYPTFAWTPDGKSIVFWAQGKIHRINVESGEVTPIPFHIKDNRQVSRAVRYPVWVAEDEFMTKALRWVQVSPDGSKAVFQTMGSIFIRDLPDGDFRPLTMQEDHFEFYPSFSRDGQSVVYTTWNDETLGSVRIAPIDGGEGVVITQEPGHYVEPVFSPDGQTVVYRTATGGYLTSPLWSQNPGIYKVPAAGGEAELVTEYGSRPQFGESNDRVFLTTSEFEKDADNRKLISVGLDGQDERVHYTSSWAQDYCIAPDGKWIAFVERYNVYLAPFVSASKTISIGPSSKAVPVAKAGADAGNWIHFSGDSKSLYWALGPKLYQRELHNSFAFLEGAPEELPEPVDEGIDLGFPVRHDNPSGSLALVGGRIVTMVGEEIIEDGVVIIEGNRIAAVGARDIVRVPQNAMVFNVAGQTIIPGFIDTHAHGPMAENGFTPQQNWVNYARLGFGVTTVHDPSNDTHSIFASSEMTKAGVIVAPRTFSTGTILYGAAGAYKTEIESMDDARFHLRRMQAIGAFSVKSYNQPRRDQRQMVLAAARELEMMVVPEGGSTFFHNLNMVVDGHTGIEHTLSVEGIYKDVLDLWKGTEVGYTPTLSVAYGGLSGEYYWYEKDDVWRNARIKNFVPPHVINPRARRRQKAPEEDYNHIKVARITKQLVDLGETVQAGGHGQLSGLCTHWEMWSFVQGGMTPFEALRSGTLHGAQYLGLDGDLGTVEMGKLADLVVFRRDEDPLSDIRASEKIQYVVANGRIYNSRNMVEMGISPRAPAPFYWERDDFSMSGTPPQGGGCHGCGIPTLSSARH